MRSTGEQAAVLWEPTAVDVESAAVTSFMVKANEVHGLNLDSYADLHRWSLEQPGDFWSMVWDECLTVRRGVGPAVRGEGMLGTTFFPHERLNVAQELLAKGSSDSPAIIAIGEDGNRQVMTWHELREAVAIAARALANAGVGSGDRVVAWVPNRAEVVVYALAALSIGAIVSTAATDFAPSAAIDRFAQIHPTVLLGATEYTYNGNRHDVRDRLDEICRGLPTVGLVLTLGLPDPRWQSWETWMSEARDTWDSRDQEFEAFSFDHPGFILFSSGTTGKPKCIVHRAAGILLKLAAEQTFNIGLKSSDTLFYYTTTGWMMWNWAVYALGTGSTIVMYDGHPMYPTIDRLFAIAEAEQVTALGVSAKFIDSLRVGGASPKDAFDLQGLRLLLSTGSPLSPESFDYAYEHCIADHAQLVSFSGGTDICGSFIGGIPTEPVYRGQLQGPILGMATEVFGADGRPSAPGEKGELVCTAPFPSLPLGFWGDDTGASYRRSYFEGFPGVWTHGDFAIRTSAEGFIVLGRSDATLNSKGVRIGTAEIYRVVEQVPGVAESLAIAQDWQGDSRVILFVRMRDGQVLDEATTDVIRARLRSQASPRHVPDLILAAPELPRTRSNKLVELTVADIMNGRPVRNTDALENPDSLDWFIQQRELLDQGRGPA